MSEHIYVDRNEAVLRNIPAGSTVLDVGCGPGYLAELLPTCNLYGIDNSRPAIRLAQEHLKKSYLCDITTEIPDMPKLFFDVIVLADILEHVVHPDAVLQKLKPFLKHTGIMIVSLPNIANWTIRLKLLFGNFTYTKTGILDRTHLRFFTRKTACDFFHQHSLTIHAVDYNSNFVRSLLGLITILLPKRENENHPEYMKRMFNSTQYALYTRFVLPVERFITRLWPTLFAYQFVFIITPWHRK